MARNVTAVRMLAVMIVVVMGVLVLSDDCSAGSENSTLSEALNQVNLFSGLTDAERAELQAIAVLRHVEKGERIIEQGTFPDKMFIVLQSPVEIRVKGKVVATFPAKALVGEMEFLDELPAAADVVLLEDSDLLELRYGALRDLMEKHHHLGYVFMHEIAKIEAGRLRKSTQK